MRLNGLFLFVLLIAVILIGTGIVGLAFGVLPPETILFVCGLIMISGAFCARKDGVI